MQLILTVGDDLSFKANKTTPDEEITFDLVFSTLLSALASYSKLHLDAVKCELTPDDMEAYENDLYDRMDSCFTHALKNIFPNIDPAEFDLSDAAIVYAQDMMIKEAAEEGISYQEALERYEQKAKDYIIQREKLN